MLAGCEAACSASEPGACRAGGEILMNEDANSPFFANAAEEERAVALFTKGCDARDARSCGLAAVARDRSPSRGEATELARAGFYERACQLGDVYACKETGDGFIGIDAARARSAYQVWCAHQRPPGSPSKCEVSANEQIAAAEAAMPSCARGESAGCEHLGDAFARATKVGNPYRRCAPVFVAGYPPLADGLGCERAGRAYDKACRARGLVPAPDAGVVPQGRCARWLFEMATESAPSLPADAGAAPARPPHVAISGVKLEGTPSNALAAALAKEVPAMTRCYAEALRGKPDAADTVTVSFFVDLTGRAAFYSMKWDADSAYQLAWCVTSALHELALAPPPTAVNSAEARVQFLP
jgi:hypothetical protein